MNPFNSHAVNPSNWPAPIVNDQHLPPVNGEHPTVYAERRNDSFDFTTGECRIARTVNGVQFDTRDATLCASVGTIDVANGYFLRRVDFRLKLSRGFHRKLSHRFGMQLTS